MGAMVFVVSGRAMHERALGAPQGPPALAGGGR